MFPVPLNAGTLSAVVFRVAGRCHWAVWEVDSQEFPRIINAMGNQLSSAYSDAVEKDRIPLDVSWALATGPIR
jgi:hypothetical protein